MSVAPIVPSSTALIERAVVRPQTTAFSAAALRNATPQEQRAAVGAQFEAILVRQLLGKTMTSMLGSQGGAAGSIYGDLLADTISQQLAAGQGFGFGRYLEQQLTPRGKAAAETAPSSANPHP